MKTQVLQLERFDDVASVCDKIHWSKSLRVLLVWPSGKKELLSRLDLVMIYREGIKTGVQLALLSSHQEVKRNARDLDIPIFQSSMRAQKVSWRRSRKIWHPIRSVDSHDRLTREVLESRRRAVSMGLSPIIPRLAIFFLGILSVISLVLFFLPGATIYVQTPSQHQLLDLQLTADPEVAFVNLSLEIPASSTSIIAEGTQQITSSGYTTIPDKTARGSVQFVNLSSQDLEIPAGTIVSTASTPPIRFRTLENATILSMERQSDEVAIAAVLPGAGGNVPALGIQVIEDKLGALVSVSNPGPTTGGTENQVPSPTAQDYAKLRDGLLASLKNQAAERMNGSIPPGSSLVPETIRMAEIVEETYSPDIGTPGDTATLSMQLKYTAIYLSQSDIKTAAQIALDTALPEGYSAHNADLVIIPLNDPSFYNNRITWKVTADRQIFKEFDMQPIVKQITGEKVTTAAEALKQDLQLAQMPVIKVVPTWWPRLPFTAFRIEVVEQ